MKSTIERAWRGIQGKVGYRIFFPFFLVTIVGAGLATAYGIRTTSRLMEERAIAQIQLDLDVLRSSILKEMDNLLTHAELTIYSSPVQESIDRWDIDGLRQLLIPMKIRSGIDMVIIFDREGKEILRLDDRGLLGKDLEDLDIVRHGLTGMTYQDIVITPSSAVMCSISPNETTSVHGGKNGAMLVGKVVDDEYLMELKKLTGTDLVVSTTRGEVIVSTARIRSLQPSIDLRAAGELLSKGAQSVLEKASYHDVPIRVTHESLRVHGEPRAMISVIMNMSQIHRSRRNIYSFMILLTICGVAALAWLSFQISRSIGGPIEELVRATGEVAGGDLSQRIERVSSDEIGRLSESFNIMTGRLRSYVEEVHAARDRAEFYSSELKKAQTQLIQASKMVAMGQLGAGIAHELNQPLLAIGLFAEQTLLGLEEGSKAHQILEKIINQTRRMAELINQIRLFSRRSLFEFEEVDIHKPLKNALSLISTQLADENVGVDLHLEKGLPPVMADENQVQQVFLNIITNARDAVTGRENGKLTISTMSLGRKGFVAVDFTDNGVGIPKEDIDEIFIPFFTTKKKIKGLGLGLSISYGIIKGHAGDISVSSAPGEDTVFRVLLPTVKAEPCWEQIGCDICLPGRNRDSCPVYDKNQGFLCWLFFLREGGGEGLEIRPGCYTCPLYMTRKGFLSVKRAASIDG